MTECTVSGPKGGIAITPVANTEYHPLLEGGGTTGCGIDTKVELRKISDVKLSSAVEAILVEGPNHRTHFRKRTIQ